MGIYWMILRKGEDIRPHDVKNALGKILRKSRKHRLWNE